MTTSKLKSEVGGSPEGRARAEWKAGTAGNVPIYGRIRVGAGHDMRSCLGAIADEIDLNTTGLSGESGEIEVFEFDLNGRHVEVRVTDKR